MLPCENAWGKPSKQLDTSFGQGILGGENASEPNDGYWIVLRHTLFRGRISTNLQGLIVDTHNPIWQLSY